MSAYEFEKQLRERLRRAPFQPFVINVNDGRRILVDAPAVAFDAGRAGFIGQDELVEFFDCENVVGFGPVSQGTAL
jgi:hypothetical protein